MAKALAPTRGVFGVVISASNEADPSSASTDELDCEKGVGYSYGYEAGTYRRR